MQSIFLLVSHYTRCEAQYCKLSELSTTGSETVCFSFQSVKLESAGNESTHFVTDIRAEKLLVRQSAEVSVLKTEENFDSCEIFKKPFPRNNTNAISGHTSASGRETLSRCQTCPTPFTHQRTAVKGMRGRERHFSCDICKMIFNSRYNLQIHSRVHTGERPFSCEVCKKRFSLLSNIIMHLKLHTGERNFSCVICKKQFAQRSCIKNHRSVHTGERPFSCKMCNKSFTQSCNWRTNIRLHTGERPSLAKKMCNKKFIVSSYLERHLLSHSGEKHFSCEVCKTSFSLRTNLIIHLRVHNGETLSVRSE
jgi:uncharacterized Zn-finger protein